MTKPTATSHHHYQGNETTLSNTTGSKTTASNDVIPEAAAPPPSSPPGPFSIGSPMFNVGLVAMLMGISFLAVALPGRGEVDADDTRETADSAVPDVLAFEDPTLDEIEFLDTAAPSTTTTVAAIDPALIEELLEELREQDTASDPETSDADDADAGSQTAELAPPPTAPTQELVQVVHRTEQIQVPVAVAPAPTTTIPPLPQCSDHTTQLDAQTAFDADPETLAHFDGDGDGRACEQLITADERALVISCDAFENQPDAQAIFDTDPQALAFLDGDGDGRACEQLPGAPVISGPQLAPAAQVLSVSAVRDQQGIFGLHTREAPWWMGELDYVSRLIGKAPNNLLFFSNWSTPFPAEQVRTAWGRGMTPQVAWEPSIPGADSQPTLRSIADGEWDPYIDEWAAAAAAHGQPIVLRLAAEMNGNWYTWSEQTNGNSEGDYVDMWRHVHSRFEAAGADNVVWLWSVNRSDNLKTDIIDYWPGEEYTDWVGISGYWRGHEGAPEPTFDSVYSNTLSELREITAKPILLAEVGAGTNVDADRINWLTTLFDGLETNPDIIGFVYFNDNKAGGDFRIQFSQGMVDVFAEGISGDNFESGALPTGMKIGDRLSVPTHDNPDNTGLAG